MKRETFFLNVLRSVCVVGSVALLSFPDYVRLKDALLGSDLYWGLLRKYWKSGVPRISVNLLTLLVLGELYGGWERLDGLVRVVGLRRVLDFLTQLEARCVSVSAFRQWIRKNTNFRWGLEGSIRASKSNVLRECAEYVVRNGYLPLCHRHARELRGVFLGFREVVVRGCNGGEYVVFSWGACPSCVSFCFVCSLV